ncbi:MAG: hypothetical protein FJ265_07015 [Planctomycetes bacterium]|nr:hypothetical protein [Planctomycetota bacterium]
MNSEDQSLELKIDAIKRELLKLGPLQPGSLSQQYNVCGKPGCRCKADPPQKHGPYYQISYTRRGKSSSRFVTRAAVPLVKQQLLNYERLRELVDRWIELSTKLCTNQVAELKCARKKPASGASD